MWREACETLGHGYVRSFEGVFNVPVILNPGQRPQFSGVQLNGIASTLETGLRLREKLREDESPHLCALAQDLALVDETILKAIRFCLRVSCALVFMN